jgi:hypothetical protein
VPAKNGTRSCHLVLLPNILEEVAKKIVMTLGPVAGADAELIALADLQRIFYCYCCPLSTSRYSAALLVKPRRTGFAQLMHFEFIGEQIFCEEPCAR